MSISEKANDLLNKFCGAQYDYVVWSTQDNLVARDKARQEISDHIAELEAAQRWRVVANGELPEDGEVVLAAFENREILTATYYKHYKGFGGVENYWHIEGWHSGNVTHWMTLPESPNDTQTQTFVYGKESEE